jgi:DNA-binding transcriptional LysR family regulator
VDVRWLRVLVELAERGTLRAVAEATGYSTSAVSQQLGALQRELDRELVEAAGRRLVLTPAGRALLPHARTVLAGWDAARGALDPGAEPVGEVRLAGFASALVRHVVPAVAALRQRHPGLSVAMQEREPDEVVALLAADAIDLGLSYDYSLVPREVPGVPFYDVPMALLVPAGERRGAAQLLADRDVGWITNSRARADDELVARVGARYGAVPRVAHRIDSLELVARLVQAGLGVALIAADGPRLDGVRYVDLAGAAGIRRGYATTRPGRERWPAVAAVIHALTGPPAGPEPAR